VTDSSAPSSRRDRHDPAAGSGEVDSLDRAIIAELQRDGRATFRAIGRRLNVPEATVRFRTNRLQEAGVISVTAFADPQRLGYGILASMFLRVAAPRRTAVIDELRTWEEVMYLSSCAGRADLMLQVVSRGLGELEGVIARRLADLDGVLEVETLVELEVHKAHYEFPHEPDS
jgi:Lrp/AsnC family transcriptional regulator for asnA, asnC and gidA